MARHARSDDYVPLPSRRLSRRRALTRGAVLAVGAAGATAVTATPAHATAGDPLIAGAATLVDTQSTTVQGASDVPTFGLSNTANGPALDAHAYTGFATIQAFHAKAGVALYGQSEAGYGVSASGGKAALYLKPSVTVGPPTSGNHLKGEVVVDALGRPYFCFADGNPGRWAQPGFNAIDPVRVCDTRLGSGTPYSTGNKVGGSKELVVDVARGAGIPVEASAVAVNVTVTEGTAPSYLVVYPAGTARPLASSINFVADQNIANGLTVKLGAGSVRIFNSSGGVHVILDVAGYFL